MFVPRPNKDINESSYTLQVGCFGIKYLMTTQNDFGDSSLFAGRTIHRLEASYLAILPCSRPPEVPVVPSFGKGYVLARGEVDMGRRNR